TRARGAERTAFSGGFVLTQTCRKLLHVLKRCQGLQRLLKVLHRDDSKAVGVPPCLGRVVPSRHEENPDPGLANSDRLLLDPANRLDGAVELDPPRSRDPVAVVDVAAELLEQVEREGEAGRGAADAAGV